MTIYTFDGTMNGLLSAVFDAFYLKEQPEQLLTEGEALPLFCERTYAVATSEEKAQRCRDIMYDCERVLRATIADSAFCEETTLRVNRFLNENGSLGDSSVNIVRQKQLEELPPYLKAIEAVLAYVDNSLYTVFSDKAYSQFWQLYFA